MSTIFSVFVANVDNVEDAAINAALNVFEHADLADIDRGSNAYDMWCQQLNDELDDAVYHIIKSALEADNSGISAKELEHVGVLLMRRINVLKLWKFEVREAYRFIKLRREVEAMIALDDVLNSLYKRDAWDVLSHTISLENEKYACMLQAYNYKNAGYFLLKVLNIPAEKWGCPYYLPYMGEYSVGQCQAANRVIKDILDDKEFLQECKNSYVFEVVVSKRVLETVEGTSTYEVFFGDNDRPKYLLWELYRLVSKEIK